MQRRGLRIKLVSTSYCSHPCRTTRWGGRAFPICALMDRNFSELAQRGSNLLARRVYNENLRDKLQLGLFDVLMAHIMPGFRDRLVDKGQK